jgi:ethanolamine utilization protein EutQ
MTNRQQNNPPILILKPTQLLGEGPKEKLILEHVGRVNTQTTAVSVALMKAPADWEEPGQTPEFDEITVVLSGALRVEYAGGVIEVGSGQSIIAQKGAWVRYTTLCTGGAEYVAICIPAFSPDTVHRDSLPPQGS